MRHSLLGWGATFAIFMPTLAHAQATAPNVRAVRTLSAPKPGILVARIERPADLAKISPAASPPVLHRTLVVQNADPLASIQRLPVQRELSLPEMQTTRALPLGNSRINLSAMLARKDALPNIGRRLQAVPAAVTVSAVDAKAYVVPQGLIVRSFLNYQIKLGACDDPARRTQIELAGIQCARRLSEAERVADFADPRSPRFVADPSKRAAAVAKARANWPRQDAEAAAQVANFRAMLANPTERAKVAAAIGAEETARLERLNNDDLAGQLISSAETKIEHVMFIPSADESDKGPSNSVSDYRHLGAALEHLPVTVTNKPIQRMIFLTGFTLGRQYEWSERVEKTIKWCWVGCAETYYAGARAGFSYGFGLRFPIAVEGNYKTVTTGDNARGFLTATMTPINGSPADYAAAGLDSSQIFRGQEFVAELKAEAGYDFNLPLIPEGHESFEVGFDFAENLPEPFAHGQFTPPAPGTTSDQAPFVFDAVDLLMGYGNWGVAGVLVHPAVEVGLHSDALRLKLHDDVSGKDADLISGKSMPISYNPATNKSSFWIGDPVYNLSFIITPGIDAHAFIDVGVWSDSWDFPVWFPDIAITLPPGGVDFACHEGTICRRGYAFEADTRPDLTGVVRAGVPSRVEGIGIAPQISSPPPMAVGPQVRPLGNVAIDRSDFRRLAPQECPTGLVERLATATDHRCVPSIERDRIAQENRDDGPNHNPAGSSGPASCVPGLVWREAVPGDTVCVTPDRRAAVAMMNH